MVVFQVLRLCYKKLNNMYTVRDINMKLVNKLLHGMINRSWKLNVTLFIREWHEIWTYLFFCWHKLHIHRHKIKEPLPFSYNIISDLSKSTTHPLYNTIDTGLFYACFNIFDILVYIEFHTYQVYCTQMSVYKAMTWTVIRWIQGGNLSKL